MIAATMLPIALPPTPYGEDEKTRYLTDSRPFSFYAAGVLQEVDTACHRIEDSGKEVWRNR